MQQTFRFFNNPVILPAQRPIDPALMPQTKKFIIDFDSTFTQVEALDILGEISLINDPEKDKKLQEIKDITDKGMEGSITFRESLEQRLTILQANRAQVNELIERLKLKVSKSFERNKEWLKDNGHLLETEF